MNGCSSRIQQPREQGVHQESSGWAQAPLGRAHCPAELCATWLSKAFSGFRFETLQKKKMGEMFISYFLPPPKAKPHSSPLPPPRLCKLLRLGVKGGGQSRRGATQGLPRPRDGRKLCISVYNKETCVDDGLDNEVAVLTSREACEPDQCLVTLARLLPVPVQVGSELNVHNSALLKC